MYVCKQFVKLFLWNFTTDIINKSAIGNWEEWTGQHLQPQNNFEQKSIVQYNFVYTQYEIDMKHCSSQARFHMERATKRAFVSASKAREHKNSIQVADWSSSQNNSDIYVP